MAIRGLSLRQAIESGDAHSEEEVVTRAGQIAKRISAFFGLAAGESS